MLIPKLGTEDEPSYAEQDELNEYYIQQAENPLLIEKRENLIR